jgi:Flp pilus assembly protein CpaB
MKKVYVLITSILLIFILMTGEAIYIRSLSDYEPSVGIVTAKSHINAGMVISAEMLEIKKVNLGSVHKLSLRRINDVAGKTARMDIEAEEALLSSKLGASDEMEGIRVLNSSSRLFTFELKPDQANGWWLKIGQYVDIIFVPDSKPETASEPIFVKRLDHIRIAAVINDRGELLGNGKRASMPKYITFEVTNKQDEFLACTKSEGRIELSSIPVQ